MEWERSAMVLRIPGDHVAVLNANMDCGVDRHNLIAHPACGSSYYHTLRHFAPITPLSKYRRKTYEICRHFLYAQPDTTVCERLSTFREGTDDA